MAILFVACVVVVAKLNICRMPMLDVIGSSGDWGWWWMIRHKEIFEERQLIQGAKK